MGFGTRNIVFWGTSGICIPFVESLRRDFDIRLIVTQPDAVGGRRRQKIVPAVKAFALEQGIDFIQPEILQEEAVIDGIKEIEPVLGVVIAYGKIIPKVLFSIPDYGTINVHFSLLPLYRGAAPVQRALENGDERTGITIFEINRRMDSGDVWAQKKFDILAEDTTETLWQRLSSEGAPFLVETMHNILGGKIKKLPQDHERATHARPVEKGEGKVDWQLTARQIFNKLRAFTPWPGLYCTTEEKLFKLTKLRLPTGIQNLTSLFKDKKPGDIISMNRQGLRVCCGEGTVIEIVEFQPQGKKPMTPFDYCLGNKLPDRLD